MSGRSFYDLANEAYIAEDYSEALKLYKSGIEAGFEAAACHAGASQLFIKEDNFTEALYHANKALELNPEIELAHFRKGVALFNLGKFSEAKVSFEDALKFKVSDTKIQQWLLRCEEMMPEVKPSSESNQERSSSVSEPKYDWYQSESDVVLNILVKDVQSEDLIHEITSNNLSMSINNKSGSKFYLKVPLRHEILPEESKIRILSTKVEVKLRKIEGIRWERLDSIGQSAIKPIVRESFKTESGVKPAAIFKKDWDKLVNQVKEEEKNEDLEGDAALNRLFQQIYADGSDEVKKAMMKSYSESGGTVLSTNWNEIGKKKVEVQPPDGMEFKKWNN